MNQATSRDGSVPPDLDPSRDRLSRLGPFGPSGPRYGASGGLIVKVVLLGIVNATVLAFLPRVLDESDVPIALAMVAAVVALDVVYLTRKRWAIPLKYLLPGTLFLLVFALFPVVYLVFISTTNQGTGNNLSKAQAIEITEMNSVLATDTAVRYDLQILANGDVDGELAYLLTDVDGNRLLGTADGATELDGSDIVDVGRRATVDGYVPLNTGEANDRAVEISDFVVPGPDGPIKNNGFGDAFAQEQTRVYDAETDTLFDTRTGVVYSPVDGTFTSSDGDTVVPGWRVGVGLDNYQRIADAGEIRGSFVRVFLWTVVFSLLSVVFTFAVGLMLAIVFDHDRMRGRKLYRSLIIIPYAIPGFMSALVWKGMFNQQFGVINEWLGTDVPWLTGQWWPYFSILLVNTWLGYPYMFLVASGALQSIPGDINEAAAVDGANGFKRFRSITLPLVLVAVAPLLVASFAFNFNNFTLIFLLTEGRPPVQGSLAGRTDILITYVYNLAFAGGGGVDYGLAAALSVVIFMIVAAISAVSFRFTKAYEDLQ